MGKLDRAFNSSKGRKAVKPRRKGNPNSLTSSSSQQHRHKKVEVIFNPTERRNYLTGFSSRKKERRAFGLAMQKVKDREAKLEERKEHREAQREKIEEIERNKLELRKGLLLSRESGREIIDLRKRDDHRHREDDHDGSCNDERDDDDDDIRNGDQGNMLKENNNRKTYQDEHTALHFGGSVSVTTTFGIPPDDDDDDDDDNNEKGNPTSRKTQFYARKQHGTNHIDEAQKLAGNFRNYIATVKGTMGSKKKTVGRQGGRKGQHGASAMKGMGNAASFKMAKKTLSKFQKGGKGSENDKVHGSGGKGKKRKGGRR